MATKLLKHNPWVIGTGTGILGVIGIRIIDYISGTDIIGTILKPIKSFWLILRDFFLSKFEVSLWFLILLPIVVIGIIILVLWLISLLSSDKSTRLNLRPPFLDYREDSFGDVMYRWDYVKNFSDKYEIIDIVYYCPKCKCMLVDFRCPICKTYRSNIKSHTEIIALIRHRIETQITPS